MVACARFEFVTVIVTTQVLRVTFLPGNLPLTFKEPKLSNMKLRGDGPITPNTSYLSYIATRRASVNNNVQSRT